MKRLHLFFISRLTILGVAIIPPESIMAQAAGGLRYVLFAAKVAQSQLILSAVKPQSPEPERIH